MRCAICGGRGHKAEECSVHKTKDMKLVFEASGLEVSVGTVTQTFSGTDVVVTGMRQPTHQGSTGRVFVKPIGEDTEREYYPQVIGAKWIDKKIKIVFEELNGFGSCLVCGQMTVSLDETRNFYECEHCDAKFDVKDVEVIRPSDE